MHARSARATEQAPREPLSTPQFFNQAGQAQQLSRLQQLFQQVIESEQALNHQCSRLVLGFHIVPLFGTADDHAKTLGGRIAADPDLAAGPALIAGKDGRPLMTFPVPLPMGDPLLVSIAFDEITAAGVDRQKRARLNGLATIYAMKALPLWEIEEDVETSCPLTLKERITLAMILCGAAHFEIAERLNCSISAISRHMGNAIDKLSTEGESAAIALAARRGWLHLPHEFGIPKKRLDH